MSFVDFRPEYPATENLLNLDDLYIVSKLLAFPCATFHGQRKINDCVQVFIIRKNSFLLF